MLLSVSNLVFDIVFVGLFLLLLIVVTRVDKTNIFLY